MKRTIAAVLVALITIVCIGGYSESDALGGGIEAEEIIPDQLPEPEQESEENMAAGDKLVNLDDLKVAYDKQQEDTNSLKIALMLKASDENLSDSAIIGTKKVLLGAKQMVTYDTGIFTDSDSNRSSGYIPTNGFDKINFSTYVPTHLAAVAYYDADFAYMKSVSHAGTNSDQTISESIPSGAAYVVFGRYTTETYYAELISNGKSEIGNLKDEQLLLNKITDVDSGEISGTDSTGFFLNKKGVVKSAGSSFVITKYAVTAGKIYKIKGNSVKLMSVGAFVGFSTNGTLAANLQTEVVVLGSTINTDYNLLYTPTENGYLYVSWVNASGYGRIKVYDPISIGTIYDELNKAAYADVAVTGTKNAGYYITSNGKLATGGTQLCISTFPVTQGKKYRITGDDVKLLGDFGLIGFATTSTCEANKQTTLIQMGSNTATDYDILYIPAVDGYLFCAWIDASGYTQLSVYSLEPVGGLTADLMRYTQYSDVPLKIQVFGDSITDESWRTSTLSWATWIPTYLAQRTINLINSGVAGSSYGHGTIPDPNGKYYDHPNGNRINDLLKDGTLETDADIIVMFAGTNNWAGETPLGQWGDNTVSTFYGAVRDAFDYLSKHTSALVIVCTPCGRYNSVDASRSKNSDGLVLNPQGKTLRQFCDAIVETAHLYEYPVVDLYYDLGWNINNVSHYCDDGLHPNLIGAKCISQFIVGRMKTHLGI